MGWKLEGALGVSLLPTSGWKHNENRPESGRKMNFWKRLTNLAFVGAFVLAQPAYAASAPQAGAKGFTDFQAYISQSRAPGADSRAEAFKVLRNFVQTADASASTPIPQAAAAPARDAYSVVNDYMSGAGAPLSAQSAAVAAPAKAADDYALVRAYSENVADKPLVVAKADKPAAASDAAEPKKLTRKDIEAVSYVGSQACVKCHRSQFGNFASTLHGDIFLKKPRSIKEKEGCEACHGPGSRHILTKETDNGAAGDIIAFRKDSPRPVEERNAICLSCHEHGDRTNWQGSTHETRGIACTNCHQLMEKVSVKHQLVKSTEAETCFQCHKDRRAQFVRSNHMPVQNGAMTCSSCHNPHGSATDKLLREASINETCYKCHADKRGPFLWEHEPVRDNCLNCHEAHGTVNEYMLKVQRPRLCSLCHQGVGHGMPGNPAIIQSMNRSCQNCHTKVHGSNSPAGMLFQR
jgi:DmsE family decaheme c-type cytochrome